MRKIITQALVVTGEPGEVLHDIDIEITNGRITGIGYGINHGDADEVVHGQGMVAVPGLVNLHAHGVTPGPLMPSGGQRLPRWNWLTNLDRNLLQGTTSVLNLCGLATMAHVRVANQSHPVHVGGATTHEPFALRAAFAADGAGIDEEVSSTTVANQIAQGALAIGELGGGQTLAGGGQDVVYLPAAFAKRHGLAVTSGQARALKEAVLGRSLEWVGENDVAAAADRIADVIAECGLPAVLATSDIASLVRDVVLPSLEPALHGIREGLRLAAEHGVPAFVHSAAVTQSLLKEISGGPLPARIIACHVNHPSYTAEEAAEMARLGRSVGWANEACVFDLLDKRAMVTTRAHWDAVFETGTVDVVATDYGPGGEHDGPLHAVRDIVDRGLYTLADAIALVSSGPADLVPGLSPSGGRLLVGGEADIVLTSREDIALVRDVLIGGEMVVSQGKPVYQSVEPSLTKAEFTLLEQTIGRDGALQDESVVARSHRGLKEQIDALRDGVSP